MDEIALRFEPPQELGAAALKETTGLLAELLKKERVTRAAPLSVASSW